MSHKIDDQLIKEAKEKIKETYASNGKKFILHLISAFLPSEEAYYSMLMEVPSGTKCAITGKDLCGFKEFAEEKAKISMKRMFISAKAALDKPDPDNDADSKTYDFDNDPEVIAYNELIKALPDSIRNERINHYSEKSNKFLCMEAILALHQFVMEEIWKDDKDLMFAVNKLRLSKSETEMTPTDLNFTAKKMTYGAGQKDVPKLKEIQKKYFEKGTDNGGTLGDACPDLAKLKKQMEG